MTTRQRRLASLMLVLAVAVSVSGCSYNRFVTQEEAIKAQWAQVQNQLQRRNDLIPNLVETVKGYAQHEEAVYKDIADAHVLALKHLLGGGKSGAFNLANSRGHSVREVVAAARPICGRPIEVKLAPRRAGDPATLVGSFERARAVLGWAPERSSLEQQIRDAWNWFKSR